jgi:hypothetical protein
MIFCGRFAILENVLAPTKFSTVDVSCVYTLVYTAVLNLVGTKFSTVVDLPTAVGTGCSTAVCTHWLY